MNKIEYNSVMIMPIEVTEAAYVLGQWAENNQEYWQVGPVCDRRFVHYAEEMKREADYELHLRLNAESALIKLAQGKVEVNNTNYKALLKKYMQHVGESEGTTFMHTIHDRTRSDVKFTDEEVRVLEVMEEELYSD